MKINHIAKACMPNGTKTIQIWTQGCKHKCTNCHSQETWNEQDGEELTNEQIINKISQIGGINAKEIHILGGEPLQQPQQTIQLIKRIKQYYDAKIKLLTGYTKETINKKYPELYDICDTIKTGRYDQKQEEWKK